MKRHLGTGAPIMLYSRKDYELRMQKEKNRQAEIASKMKEIELKLKQYKQMETIRQAEIESRERSVLTTESKLKEAELKLKQCEQTETDWRAEIASKLKEIEPKQYEQTETTRQVELELKRAELELKRAELKLKVQKILESNPSEHVLKFLAS